MSILDVFNRFITDITDEIMTKPKRTICNMRGFVSNDMPSYNENISLIAKGSIGSAKRCFVDITREGDFVFDPVMVIKTDIASSETIPTPGEIIREVILDVNGKHKILLTSHQLDILLSINNIQWMFIDGSYFIPLPFDIMIKNNMLPLWDDTKIYRITVDFTDTLKLITDLHINVTYKTMLLDIPMNQNRELKRYTILRNRYSKIMMPCTDIQFNGTEPLDSLEHKPDTRVARFSLFFKSRINALIFYLTDKDRKIVSGDQIKDLQLQVNGINIGDKLNYSTMLYNTNRYTNIPGVYVHSLTSGNIIDNYYDGLYCNSNELTLTVTFDGTLDDMQFNVFAISPTMWTINAPKYKQRLLM